MGLMAPEVAFETVLTVTQYQDGRVVGRSQTASLDRRDPRLLEHQLRVRGFLLQFARTLMTPEALTR